MMCLSRNNILPLFLLLGSTHAQDFDNAGLRRAVHDWLADPEAATITYGAPIEDWITWKVSDMSRLFQGADKFSANLNGWDTSSVTDMNHMFAGATSFDSDLSLWDVSQVTDFSYFAYKATTFTGKSLGAWDTSSATTMEQMFLGATAFVGPENIGEWDVSSVTTMYGMLFQATSFERSINGWNMTNVRYINSLFERASSFSQQVCWPRMHPHAKCFQCFCGTNGAGFDRSEACPLSVHPSILAYSQACDPDDVLEELVESQVFGRPDLSGDAGAGLEPTGNNVNDIAGLPSIGTSGGEESEATVAEETTPSTPLQNSDSEQPDENVVVAEAQREESAATPVQGTGLISLSVILLSMAKLY